MDKLPTIRRIPSDLWMEIAPILGKEKEGAWNEGKTAGTVQDSARWNTVRPEDRMPVEISSKGIWIWFDVPQTFPAVG